MKKLTTVEEDFRAIGLLTEDEDDSDEAEVESAGPSKKSTDKVVEAFIRKYGK